ncbi:RDD family protein [Nonomuraea typhae]|uniref:RDD family protein n=1 Tax=Nonomuraea typhae TaxID=2603600 RepID=UPI0012FAC4F5|nr:RDD family protein [Nonomuraea typhae]
MTNYVPGGSSPYGDPHGAPQGAPQGAHYGAPQPQGGHEPPSPPLAEWWQRLVARIVDGVILGIAYFVLSLILATVLGGGFLAVMLTAIVGAVIYFAYEFVMLRSDGQTVGKKVMGLRVVPAGGNRAGSSLTSDAVVSRAGVLWGPLALSFIPVIGFAAYLVYLVNVLWQFWDKPLQQCLHDKLAGTVVVRVK